MKPGLAQDAFRRAPVAVVGIPVVSLALLRVPDPFLAALLGASAIIATVEAARIAARTARVSAHWIAGALLFAGGGLLHLFLLRRAAGPEGALWMLIALAVAWGGEIGGFLVGRAWGRHRMAPLTSPRKTWEGAAGSIVFSLGIVALLVAVVSNRPLDVPVLLVAALANVFAQIGDLLESAFKRAHGVKDSGTVLPGHGGMLDCIDGLCLAAPILYWVRPLLS